MRMKIKVQEQTIDAILKKNLNYVENELKGLQSIDYTSFNDAENWMKDAKVKLDNFQANNENPHYIAFDMLAGAKQNPNHEDANDDFDNLLSDSKVEK